MGRVLGYLVLRDVNRLVISLLDHPGEAKGSLACRSVLYCKYYYASRMASSLTDPFIGAGGVLVAAGSVLVGVGIAESAGSHHSVGSNPWFDVGCALVALGLVLVIAALITSWRRSRRDDQVLPGRVQPLGVGLGALIPDPLPPPPPSPLHLKLVDESWRLIYDAVWVFGLAIRITNLTEKPIILTTYYLAPHSGAGPRPPLDPKVWASVNASTKQLKEDHKSELFDGELTVPPQGSVTRWKLNTSYFPIPDGGRPRCTFGMKDTLGNDYKFEIPARSAETYHS